MPNIGNQWLILPLATVNDDQGVVHIDYNFSPTDALSFVYLIDDSQGSFPYFLYTGASLVDRVQRASSARATNQFPQSDWYVHVDPHFFGGKD